MNYDTLFPKMLKTLPNIIWNTKFENSRVRHNDSSINIFIPKSKKYLLWLTEFDGHNYSVLLTIHNNKVVYTNFIYLGFDYSLSHNGGTLIYCAKTKNQLCCYKTMYYKGKNHNEKHTFLKHLDLMHYIIKYEIKSQDDVKVCLPYMSHHRDPIMLCSTFSYPVYEIFNLNNRYIKVDEYCAYFNVLASNIKRDIYELYCKNNNELVHYCTANMTNHHISHVLRCAFDKTFKSYHKTQDYTKDNEEKLINQAPRQLILKCIYCNASKKWTPIEIVDKGQNKYYVSNKYKVMQIERNYNQSNKKGFK